MTSTLRRLGPSRTGVQDSGSGEASRPRRSGHRSRNPLTGGRWAALAFVAPLIVYLGAFYVFPLYRNLDLSLHDYTPRAFVQGDADFVGATNFVEVITSTIFTSAVVNTLVFTLVSISVQFALGLALAVFFRTNFPLSIGLRAAFLIPWLLPMIVSASTWSWMLNSDNGIVNSVLTAFGRPDQLADLSGGALVSVIIANVWLGIPFNLVILYAGLQNIPTTSTRPHT